MNSVNEQNSKQQFIDEFKKKRNKIVTFGFSRESFAKNLQFCNFVFFAVEQFYESVELDILCCLLLYVSNCRTLELCAP